MSPVTSRKPVFSRNARNDVMSKIVFVLLFVTKTAHVFSQSRKDKVDEQNLEWSLLQQHPTSTAKIPGTMQKSKIAKFFAIKTEHAFSQNTKDKMGRKNWDALCYENRTRLQMKYKEQKWKVKIKMFCNRYDRDKSEEQRLRCSLSRKQHTSPNEI